MAFRKNEQCIEIIREMINIGMGNGASILNMMLNSHIVLQVPDIKFVNRNELLSELSDNRQDKLTAVSMGYTGEISGDVQLIFNRDSAVQLVTVLVGEDAADDMVEDLGAGALVEMGNVVLNGVMGSMSNMLKFTLSYSVPGYIEDTAENLVMVKIDDNDASILMAKTSFEIKEFNITGNLVLFFKDDSVSILLEAIRSLIEDLT